MKKELHASIRKLFAFVLALCLLMTSLIFPAAAAEDWENVYISLQWFPSEVHPDGGTVAATRVEGTEHPSFWAYLYQPDAINELILNVFNFDDPSFTYSGNGEAIFPMESGTAMDEAFAYPITVYQDGQPIGLLYLYVSTQAEQPEPYQGPEYIPDLPEYVPEPQPEYVPEPQPEYVPEPQPEYVPEPEPEYIPDAQQQPVIEAPNNPENVVGFVTVYYLRTDGVQMMEPQQALCVDENSVLTPPPIEGYHIVTDPVTVTVYPNGVTDPQNVTFYYAPTPVIDVIFQDDEGNVLAQDVMNCIAAQDYQAYAREFDNYRLISDSVVNISIAPDGVATPAQAIFIYQYAGPSQVAVHYTDPAGNPVAPSQTLDVVDGSNYIAAAPEGLPEDYQPVSELSATVTVFKGVPSPTEVTFVYEQAPAEDAPLTVNYVDRTGVALVDPVVLMLPGGQTTTVTPDANLVPAGYELCSTGSFDITVSRKGETDVAEVTFTYRPIVMETPIPAGEIIDRYATTVKTANVRLEPNAKAKLVVKDMKAGTPVWAIQEQAADDGTLWTWVKFTYKGKEAEGYIRSDLVSMMSGYDSEDYELVNGTPVPRTEFTPVPTEEPTPEPTEEPTPEPTEEPTPEPTEEPTPTPTVEPTATPTVEPTEAPTEEPTEAPTEEPTEAPTEEPTEAPTEVPTEEPTEAPTAEPTAVPEVYAGYALTNDAVAIRTEVSTADASIIARLEKNTLVSVSGQVYPENGSSWSSCTTLDNVQGMIADSSLRRITNEEADYYIRQWNEAHATATPSPTPSPAPLATAEPLQQKGYAYALGDDVYFRSMPSTNSAIFGVLVQNTVVYVKGQYYDENGTAWHIVQYGSNYGYIRADLLRLMSAAEEQNYIASLTTPTPAPANTPAPYNEDAMSSYGYVNSSSVNFRVSPATSASLIKGRQKLYQYAFCLVLGTEQGGGNTWYKVSYNGTVGYIMANYFTQLKVSELQDFLNSPNYTAGVQKNNSTTGNTSTDYTGSTSAGNTSGSNTTTNGSINAAEDQTVNTWQSGATVSYAPFNPYATVAPLATTAPISTLAPGATVPPTTGTDDPWQEFSEIYAANASGYQKILSSTELLKHQTSDLAVKIGEDFVELPEDAKVLYDTSNGKVYVQGELSQAEATVTPTEEPTATESPLETEQPFETDTGSGLGAGWIFAALAVVVLLGGGFYAYSLSRKNAKKQAARLNEARRNNARQQMNSRNGSDQPGTFPQNQARPPYQPGQPTGGNYQRPVSGNGTFQRPDAANPQGYRAGQNPYAKPEATTPVPRATDVNPFTRPTDTAAFPRVQEANPYSRPAAPAADYRRPVNVPTDAGTAEAEIVKPITAPLAPIASTTAAPAPTTPTPAAPAAPAPAENAAEDAAPRRRRRRPNIDSDEQS